MLPQRETAISPNINIQSAKEETPMSNPAFTSEATLKDFLIRNDEQYRELANEHRRYDQRLNELAALAHPNEQEIIEETILKKKKLFLKDQMETIAARYRTSNLAH
jgi:uncharacterized protein YdcH (DUF465 family)